MRQWLIPAIVLLAVGGMGLGVGWSINEWQDGGGSGPVATPAVQAEPTQAELDAEGCKAALGAAGNAAGKGPGFNGLYPAPGGSNRWGSFPSEIQQLIDRYCH